MPGRRRSSPPSGGRAAASKRAKVTAAYQRRNDRAVALGYISYYDYRVHGSGRIPPDVPAPRGEALARLRGHRGPKELSRAVKRGSLVTALDAARGKDGQLERVLVTVFDPKTGKERNFLLRGKEASQVKLDRLVKEVKRKGGVIGLWYPIRARR